MSRASLGWPPFFQEGKPSSLPWVLAAASAPLDPHETSQGPFIPMDYCQALGFYFREGRNSGRGVQRRHWEGAERVLPSPDPRNSAEGLLIPYPRALSHAWPPQWETRMRCGSAQGAHRVDAGSKEHPPGSGLNHKCPYSKRWWRDRCPRRAWGTVVCRSWLLPTHAGSYQLEKANCVHLFPIPSSVLPNY